MADYLGVNAKLRAYSNNHCMSFNIAKDDRLYGDI